MTNDIQYDFDAITEKIEDTIGYVKSLRNDKQYKQLFSPEYCENLEKKEKELKKYIEAPFNVMIVGDFKRGKSSFINALLGKELLPSDITPETVTVNTVTYGDADTAEIYLENNTKKIIPMESLKRESLESILKQLPAKPKYISVKDNNEILKNINFIDTPGLNDAVDSFDEVVIDYLSKADAVIYVVSASFPMSRDEQNFLSEIIIPASLAKVIVIVNMCDCLESEEEINLIKKATQKKCYEINPEIEVYAISSLDELRRLGQGKIPNPDTSEYLGENFSFLTQAIQSEIVYKTESLKAVNCINHTKLLLRDVNKKCLSLKKSISNQNEENLSSFAEKEKSVENRKQEIEVIKKEISELVDNKLQEASLWMRQYLLRIREEIQNATAKATTDDIEKNIKFYFSDMLKKGFEACINCHIKELSEKLQADLKSISLDNSNFNTSGIDEKIDINGTLDTLGVVEALETSNLLAAYTFDVLPFGSSLLSITQLVEGVFRENRKKSTNFKAKLSEQLLAAYNTIETKTQESVNCVYSQYKQNVIEKINQLSEEEQLNFADSLAQAKTIIDDKAKDNKLLLSDLDTVIAETEKYYNRLCFFNEHDYSKAENKSVEEEQKLDKLQKNKQKPKEQNSDSKTFEAAEVFHTSENDTEIKPEDFPNGENETFMEQKREDPEPYKGDKSFVFISYSHRDKERVYPIIKKLIELGVRIWFDEAIVPSVEWDEDIAQHINNCEGMISFISKTYIDSKNCIAELKYARKLNRQQLSIYLEDTELPAGIDMFLCGIQAIKMDLSLPQNNRKFYDRILECPFIDSIIKTE